MIFDVTRGTCHSKPAGFLKSLAKKRIKNITSRKNHEKYENILYDSTVTATNQNPINELSCYTR